MFGKRKQRESPILECYDPRKGQAADWGGEATRKILNEEFLFFISHTRRMFLGIGYSIRGFPGMHTIEDAIVGSMQALTVSGFYLASEYVEAEALVKKGFEKPEESDGSVCGYFEPSARNVERILEVFEPLECWQEHCLGTRIGRFDPLTERPPGVRVHSKLAFDFELVLQDLPQIQTFFCTSDDLFIGGIRLFEGIDDVVAPLMRLTEPMPEHS